MYGGSVPIVLDIMDVTASLGMKPVLLATDPSIVSVAEERGIEVWPFPGIVRRPRPVHDLLTAWRLSRALRARGIRVVHTHTSKGGMVGRLGARLAGCDVVIHHTHGFYHAGLRPGLRRSAMVALERIFGWLDDRQVFINSQEFDDAVTAHISKPRQARLVFNGISDVGELPTDPETLRRQWGVPEHGLVVGSVSRIDFEQKGLDVGIEAFRMLLDAGVDAWWVIAGTGADRDELVRLAEECGVAERVRLLGHVPGAGVLNRAFDVNFAPSNREGQSVSLLEAVACGTPVVTTRIAGNLDVTIDGSTALLAEAGDPAGMADALRRMLQDRALAQQLASAAHERYERLFTIRAFSERIRRLYLDAFGEPVPFEIVLTPMRAAHVPEVVDVHLRSFPGFVLTTLGARFLRTYYRSVARDASATSFVAMAQGRVVGFVVGSSDPAGFYRRLLLRRWWAFGLAAVPAVLRRPRTAQLVMAALQHPGRQAAGAEHAGLFSIAVAPGLQRQGVGALLVDLFCRAAESRGATSVELETDAEDNEGANAFYRARGFTESRRYVAAGNRPMIAYVRELSDEEDRDRERDAC